MTKDQMLEQLNLSPPEFQDLIEKLTKFTSSLSEAQLKVVKASSLSLPEAAATFGEDMTSSELENILRQSTTKSAFLVGINFASIHQAK